MEGKIELFSFPSIIQDVYYLLLCAAANFMPQQIWAQQTDSRISDCLCHFAHRRVIYVKMGFSLCKILTTERKWDGY